MSNDIQPRAMTKEEVHKMTCFECRRVVVLKHKKAPNQKRCHDCKDKKSNFHRKCSKILARTGEK
jgi:hypothetical protein